MSKIIFSLNSIYKREENLKFIIPNLVKQCDILYINMIGYPTDYKPKGIITHKKIELNFLNEGGSETRFLKYIDCEDDSYFFTLDDDILYPKNYSEILIQKMKQYNNNSIVCVHGSIIDLKQDKDFYKKGRLVYHFTKELKEDKKVIIPGVGTSCFYKKNFNINLKDFKNKNMSDPYVGVFAHKQNVDVICVERSDNWLKIHDEKGVSIWGNNPFEEIDKLFNENLKN
jgi:hypothetical protein